MTLLGLLVSKLPFRCHGNWMVVRSGTSDPGRLYASLGQQVASSTATPRSRVRYCAPFADDGAARLYKRA